jgi:hypothetical protein
MLETRIDTTHPKPVCCEVSGSDPRPVPATFQAAPMWRQVLGNVGGSGRMGRVLVVGPDSDEGLDAMETSEGLVVEHLVFDSIQAGAVGVAHPARRVWIGRNSLGGSAV